MSDGRHSLGSNGMWTELPPGNEIILRQGDHICVKWAGGMHRYVYRLDAAAGTAAPDPSGTAAFRIGADAPDPKRRRTAAASTGLDATEPWPWQTPVVGLGTLAIGVLYPVAAVTGRTMRPGREASVSIIKEAVTGRGVRFIDTADV